MNNKRNIKFVSVILFIMLITLNFINVKEVKAEDSLYKYVTKWGTTGKGNGQFDQPYGIAVDPKGNVYVADAVNNRIQRFDSNGKFITKWGTTGKGNGQFDYPYAVAVDPKGNVYVGDDGNNRIQKFNSNGKFINKWGTKGKGDGQLYGPVGVAVDSKGNVYVVDMGNSRIQKFDSNGKFITKWGIRGKGNGQFDDPSGIAVDSKGNVYVADVDNNRIQKFDSNGKFITKWGTCGSGDGQFSHPVEVAVDPKGNVYVSDFSNSRIQKFDSNGRLITWWNTSEEYNNQYNGQTVVEVNCSAPDGVAVDSEGNVYVADNRYNFIQKFSIKKSITQTLIINNGSNIDLKNYFTVDSNILNSLIWVSSDNSIATVNKGVVTALEAGTVTITATGCGETIYGKFTINVEPQKDNSVLQDGKNIDLAKYLNLNDVVAKNLEGRFCFKNMYITITLDKPLQSVEQGKIILYDNDLNGYSIPVVLDDNDHRKVRLCICKDGDGGWTYYAYNKLFSAYDPQYDSQYDLQYDMYYHIVIPKGVLGNSKTEIINFQTQDGTVYEKAPDVTVNDGGLGTLQYLYSKEVNLGKDIDWIHAKIVVYKVNGDNGDQKVLESGNNIIPTYSRYTDKDGKYYEEDLVGNHRECTGTKPLNYISSTPGITDPITQQLIGKYYLDVTVKDPHTLAIRNSMITPVSDWNHEYRVAVFESGKLIYCNKFYITDKH